MALLALRAVETLECYPQPMQITVDIPDQFVHLLVREGRDAARILLEEAVASAYRERRLKTVEQVRQLLGFQTRMQATTFLLEHEIYDYTVADLDADTATLERLFPSKPE